MGLDRDTNNTGGTLVFSYSFCLTVTVPVMFDSKF